MAAPSKEATQALHNAERAHDRLSAHETLCTQRWDQLNDTILEVKASVRRLYTQQWGAAGAIIMLLLTVIGFLWVKLP